MCGTSHLGKSGHLVLNLVCQASQNPAGFGHIFGHACPTEKIELDEEHFFHQLADGKLSEEISLLEERAAASG